MDRPADPRVTVIIPVYGQSGELARCLDAIRRQTFPAEGTEVVVVDNGSEPPIALGDTDPTIRCVRETQPGSYAARNRGIETSRGAILAFTDADCVPAADWLERGVARMRALGDGMVGGKVDVTVRAADTRTLAERYEQAWAFPQQGYIEYEGFSATANLFTTRRTFDLVGVFDPTLLSCGDLEWGQRVRARGLPQVYAADVRVSHAARRGVRDLVIKARRVAASTQILAGRRGRGFIGVLSAVKRCFLRFRYHAGDARVGGPVVRAQLAALTVLLESVAVLERSRVYLGGAARRI